MSVRIEFFCFLFYNQILFQPRMDQYFQHMEKKITKLNFSSRIKFAVKDIFDLRASNWVPRRELEGNPTTINEIHRKIQQKTKKGILC